MPSSISRKSLSAVILGGGKSRRMRGRDKSKMRLTTGGPTQLERAIASLRPFARNIYFANGRRWASYRNGIRSIHAPEYCGHGPLEGLAAASKAVRTPWVLILPVDIAPMDRNLIQALVFGPQSKARYVSQQGRHSLCLLLPRWALRQSLFILEKHERRVSVYLRSIEACPVCIHPLRLRNLNRPSDWRAARWKRRP